MSDAKLTQLRDLIQNDIGKRGLATDPLRNLINACPDDFALACKSLSEHPQPSLAVVTGFIIPSATPPAGETDGPLGALFLARALVPIGIPVTLISDTFCERALEVGLAECDLQDDVPLVTLPTYAHANDMSDETYCEHVKNSAGGEPWTHLLAIERVGPSHTIDTILPEHRNRCHTMRGRDITEMMSPAERLFAYASGSERITTIGIGDGGNEIGMGKISWDVIERNIPNGGLVACRVAAEHLIVCGVSNWGAYALAAGVALLRGQSLARALFDPERERRILDIMVRDGQLVDGVLAKPSVTVDGLTWQQYADVLVRVGNVRA